MLKTLIKATFALQLLFAGHFAFAATDEKSETTTSFSFIGKEWDVGPIYKKTKKLCTTGSFRQAYQYVEFVPVGCDESNAQFMIQVQKNPSQLVMPTMEETKNLQEALLRQAAKPFLSSEVTSFGAAFLEFIVSADSTTHEYNIHVIHEGKRFIFNVRKNGECFNTTSERFTENRKKWKKEFLDLVRTGKLRDLFEAEKIS